MSRSHFRVFTLPVVLLASPPNHAHHSGAIYDMQTHITLEGTVAQFQWTNPHCWIQLQVSTDSDVQEWSIEMGNITELYRRGWRPGSLKPGQQITVVISPLRTGKAAGIFVSGARTDGMPLPITGNRGATP